VDRKTISILKLCPMLQSLSLEIFSRSHAGQRPAADLPGLFSV